MGINRVFCNSKKISYNADQVSYLKKAGMSFDFREFIQSGQKATTHTLGEVNALRIGGASIQMLDPVTVEAYGARMKLAEVASLSAHDPQTLVISPWDTSLLAAIEKGIQQANLNLSPVVDGKIVRISVPALTEETRQQMVKILNQKIEDGRIMIRGLRADTKKEIEKQAGAAGVSEDDIKKDLTRLETETKKFIDELEHLLVKKTEQLLKV